MLKLSKTLIPVEKRLPTSKLIKDEFRKNFNEKDEIKIAKLLKRADSSLSYLKMTTPRDTDIPQNGAYRVDMHGESQRGDKKGNRPISNWTPTNMDPDSVARHDRSLKRAGFKSNSDMKGIF
jgi:hypothetical protein